MAIASITDISTLQHESGKKLGVEKDEDEILPNIFEITSIPFTILEQARIEFYNAKQLANQGKLLEAKQNMVGILEQIPEYHAVRLKLIEILYSQEAYDNAFEQVSRGLDIDPKNEHFLLFGARILQAKGDYQAAIRNLLIIPESKRNDSRYKELLAQLYLHEGYYELAEKHFTHLVIADSNNSAWKLGLALAQDRMGNFKQAKETFADLAEGVSFNPDVIDYIKERLTELSNMKT